MEYGRLSPQECAEALGIISAEVEIFWLTDTVREFRPKVIDEIRHGLGLVSTTLFEIVPRLYRDMEASILRVFPAYGEGLPTLVRFGTWIGGDRDGNPHVTPDVTREAVRLNQDAVLRHYLDKVVELGKRLSHSRRHMRPGDELVASLAKDRQAIPQAGEGLDDEPYREKCRHIAVRLRRTLDSLLSIAVTDVASDTDEPPSTESPGVYASAQQLQSDLAVVADDLQHRPCGHMASILVKDLLREVDVFGMHMLKLDIRQHSARHAAALNEIFAWAGVCPRYLKLTSSERFELLERELRKIGRSCRRIWRFPMRRSRWCNCFARSP